MTIMFADIRGSVALTSGMDPERVDEVLSATIGKMMRAVDRYGGTVNRVSGDGIMAIFGAPLAHEHHAEQACHAALAILQDAQSDAADGLGPVRIRVGLHSGEVVMRDLVANSTAYYEAMGLAVSVAARMEQAAEAGRVVISPQTRRLAGDAVEVRSLGLQPVKGLEQPMELFELQAIATARQHAHHLQWDSTSRFVGRKAELSKLTQALHIALAGAGGAVAVRGEAGSGKVPPGPGIPPPLPTLPAGRGGRAGAILRTTRLPDDHRHAGSAGWGSSPPIRPRPCGKKSGRVWRQRCGCAHPTSSRQGPYRP